MSTVTLIILINLVLWIQWCIEEAYSSEDRQLNKMVKDDLKARKKRGDIVKEDRRRGNYR